MTLDIKNLQKTYDGFELKDVSFSLPKGYIMGLIGPNGAGKTTIIKSIMNLIMKDGGNIEIFGKDHQEDEVEIKQRIGFVYDNPDYYDHLTLKQFKNVIAPFYKNWDEDLYGDIVKRFDVPENKALGKFSKGMAMKGALAIALSHHADFIIMDEPTSGLDPVFRRELLDFLREIMQDGNRSILFSTHITSDVEQIADYITFIFEGTVAFSKTKDEIAEQFALVKGGKDLLNEKPQQYLTGVRENEFGFEALTDDLMNARKRLGDQAIYDKATLEDIMYFTKLNI